MVEAEKWPQVAEVIAGQIRDGSLPVGARLPRAQDLARTHHVAERTARKAIAYLAQLGILEVRASIGTFVIAVPDLPLPDARGGGDRVAGLETEVARLREQQAVTHAQLLELYDRLGQPRPGTDTTTTRQTRQGRRSG